MPRTAARHARPARRSAWRPLAGAAAGLAVLALGGQGVYAALSASATNVAPQTAASGTLSLTMAPQGTGFAQAVGPLAPGDVVHRYVDLTNSGNLAAQNLTLAVASTGSAVLRTDTTRGLRLTVSSCSGAWTPSTGACSGTVTQLVAPTLVGTLATPVTLVPGAVPTAAVQRLQVSLRLPDTDETTTNGVPPSGTVQGQSASLTYTFTVQQRTATTTTS
jgi:hypothetical protein